MGPLNNQSHQLQASEPVLDSLEQMSQQCIELWNMALQQRRNKYAWGHAGFESQAEEIRELQAEFEDFAAIPSSVLEAVVWELDQAYSVFLKELQAYKKKQRPDFPPLPQFKSDQDTYPLHFTGDEALNVSQQEIQIRLGPNWLDLSLSPKPIHPFTSLVIYPAPPQWRAEIKP